MVVNNINGLLNTGWTSIELIKGMLLGPFKKSAQRRYSGTFQMKEGTTPDITL